MARRGSLDSMFSDLLQEVSNFDCFSTQTFSDLHAGDLAESSPDSQVQYLTITAGIVSHFQRLFQANVWAKKDRIGSGTIRMTHVNGRRLEDKDDYAIEACLEQLARAISAHVTDILIDRLGIEERIAQRNDSETQSSSRTLSTPRSLPQSPTLRPRSRLPRPMSSSATRQTQLQPQSQYDRKCLRVRGDGTLLRYHSENRLNRIEPAPDNNETPLENRASRLRRATRGDGTLLRYHSENRLNRIEPPPDNNETPLENRASRLRRATVGKKLADRGDSPYIGRNQRQRLQSSFQNNKPSGAHSTSYLDLLK
ncbi:unnamed protein product [Haemonchus placei]|uniref:Uncharacterized protein n=1 Tax=Haemonchus placei TaxID=6290 RepID=A0A0N4X317_HAEPC|nr:unnamed protein product [Haemonchus placei]